MRVVAGSPSHDPASTRRISPGWLLLVSLAWFAFIAGVYYRRAWIVLIGPEAFVRPELGQSLLSTGVPYAREAVVRAAVAVTAAGVNVAAFLGAGRLFDPWLLPPSLRPSERWAVRLATGAGVWSVAFFGLAWCGLYKPPIVGIALIAGACAGVAFALARKKTKGAVSPTLLRSGNRHDLVWRVLVLAAAGVAFVTALAPEIEYDALWYHLELPRRWLAAGRPVDDLTEYISLYPLTWNLLYGGALSLDGAPAAKLLHWNAYVAAGIVGASIAERALGVKCRPLAAAVFLTAPSVLWEATTAYVDLAVALHVGIGVGALWAALRDDDRRWMWLAGTHLGLACATKHLALVPTTIALLLVFVSAWRARTLAAVARRIMPVLVLTLALPAPWYVRSAVASRNPVFPEMYTVFGAAPPERWDRLTERGLAGFKAHFGGERTPTALATLPWDVTMHSWKYGGTLGPLVLMLLPCVIAVSAGSAAARWLALGLLMYGAVWSSPISSFQLRFLVPWWLLATPLIASGAERLIDSASNRRRWMGGVVTLMLAAVIGLNLPPFTPLHERDREGWDRWLTHVVRRVPIEVIAGGISSDQWLRNEVRTYAAWTYLNERSPKDARVLTFFGGDHFYAQRGRLWSEAVIARPVTWGATDVPLETLLKRLDALGITYVMAPPPHRQTSELKALSVLQPSVLGEAFDRVYQDEWTMIYRRRPAPTGRDPAGPLDEPG